MTKDRVLFETEVGSFMWGMGTKESDRDIMQVYARPTRDILSGKVGDRNKPSQKFIDDHGLEWEYQYIEIGHLVNLLIKGNCNALWVVTSPIVLKESLSLRVLREIAINNLSKASYASISGMAISSFKDHTKRPQLLPNKAYKQSLRTLTFGINLLEKGKVIFTPIKKEVAKEDIEDAFARIENAYARSKLPEVPKEEEFRDFLYNLRVNNGVRIMGEYEKPTCPICEGWCGYSEREPWCRAEAALVDNYPDS